MFSPRTVIAILSILLTGVSLDAGDYLESLREYAGRWVGYYKVQSTVDGRTEVFPVEQRYWLEGDRLKGLAVFSRDSKIESSSSVTYLDGEVLVSEVRRGATIERYLGVMREDGVVWYSSDLERLNEYKFEDSFSLVAGERILRSEGYDLRFSEFGPVGVFYAGELVRESD